MKKRAILGFWCFASGMAVTMLLHRVLVTGDATFTAWLALFVLGPAIGRIVHEDWQ